MAGFLDQLSQLLSGELRQELAFPLSEYRDRVSAATVAMAARGIDVLVTTHLPNTCYLTGYQFTNCDYAGYLLLAQDGRAAMVVPGTEVSTVLLHGWVRDVRDFPSWEPLSAIPLIRAVVEGWELGESLTLGVELGLELMDTQNYRGILAAFPDSSVVDATDLLFDERLVKSRQEVAHQRQAARYSDAGMIAALRVAAGRGRECDVAAAAADEMIALGSEFFSTAPTVAAGKSSAVAGSMFGRAAIGADDPVVIELAGVHQRYSVPVARTAVPVGRRDVAELYSVASKVLDGFLATACPGAVIGELVALALSHIGPVANRVLPVSTLGFGIGVDMPPNWRAEWNPLDIASTVELTAGMTFYSVVSLRIPGQFGVLVGDSWLCDTEGAVRLTLCPRQLNSEPALTDVPGPKS